MDDRPFFNGERAVVSGVLGAVAMTLFFAFARVIGVGPAWELALGARLSTPPVHEQWMLGMVLHVLASVPLAVGYALVFERVLWAAGALRGAMVGMAHGFLNVAVLVVLPWLLGRDVLLAGSTPLQAASLWLGTILFGVVVGAGYGTIAGERRAEPRPA